MKYFYDTEFIEDGKTIEPISIGIVAEDGRELYLVNDEVGAVLYDRIRAHGWLMGNVVPHLPLEKLAAPKSHYWLAYDDTCVVPRQAIGNLVRDFLLEDMSGVELWAWYGAYDHVALAQLFGTMMDLPEGIPMWTNDLQQEIARRGISEEHLPQQAGEHHNALADARHLRDLYAFVTAGEATR